MEPVTFSLAAEDAAVKKRCEHTSAGSGARLAIHSLGRVWLCCSSQSARHGPDTIDQERKREKGAGGKGDGCELESFVWSCELNRRTVVSAECASTIKWSLAQAEGTGMASRSALVAFRPRPDSVCVRD
jgi:hypothetical protein